MLVLVRFVFSKWAWC